MNFQDIFSVDRKVVCVTGGGGGIGRGIAGGFVAGGAKVYIASRGDLSEAAAELDAEGPGQCLPLRADLSNDEDITSLVQTLKEREGRLDVLVNNAALGNFMYPFEEFPMEAWDQMNRVNVRAPFALTRECLPLLEVAGKDDNHAAVINIVSIDGIRIPSDDDWAYGMGKAGLIHLTRQWAGRLGNNGGRAGGRNLTFNAIAPGPFPGMMDEPGSLAGIIISPIPHLGPEASILISFPIFIRLTARVFNAPWASTMASCAARPSNLLLPVTKGSSVNFAI